MQLAGGLRGQCMRRGRQPEIAGGPPTRGNQPRPDGPSALQTTWGVRPHPDSGTSRNRDSPGAAYHGARGPLENGNSRFPATRGGPAPTSQSRWWSAPGVIPRSDPRRAPRPARCSAPRLPATGSARPVARRSWPRRSRSVRRPPSPGPGARPRRLRWCPGPARGRAARDGTSPTARPRTTPGGRRTR